MEMLVSSIDLIASMEIRVSYLAKPISPLPSRNYRVTFSSSPQPKKHSSKNNPFKANSPCGGVSRRAREWMIIPKFNLNFVISFSSEVLSHSSSSHPKLRFSFLASHVPQDAEEINHAGIPKKIF